MYHFQAMCPKDLALEQLRLQREKEHQRIQRQRREALANLSDIERERRSVQERKVLKEKYRVLEIKLSEQDALLEEFLNAERLDLLDTQQCPHCHVQIEKLGGCSHMLCSNCNANFIWGFFERPQSSNRFSFLTDETNLDFAKEEFNEIATEGRIEILSKKNTLFFFYYSRSVIIGDG